MVLKESKKNMIKRIKCSKNSCLCTICFNYLKKNNVINKLTCDHIFHIKCL